MRSIKFFLLLFLSLLTLFFIVLYSTISIKNTNLINLIKNDETNLIKSINEDIDEKMLSAFNDIAYISSELEKYDFKLENENELSVEINSIQNQLSNIMIFRKLYKSFIYSTNENEFIFGLDFNGGDPKIIKEINIDQEIKHPTESDENFYNPIFIEGIKLNMTSQNKIEKPYIPIIEFVVPIINKQTSKARGYLTVEYLADNILSNLKEKILKNNMNSEFYLLNPEAYYIISPNENESFAFMFEQKNNKKNIPNINSDKVYRFNKAFRFDNKNENEWQKIKSSAKGQFGIKEKGLYTYTTFTPVLTDNKIIFNAKIDTDFYWKIVSKISREKLDELGTYSFTYYLTEIYSFTFLSIIISIIVTFFYSRKKSAEVKLNESETKFEEIFSLLGEGVIVLNSNQEIILMNIEAENLLGYKFLDFYNSNFHEKIGHKDVRGNKVKKSDSKIFKTFNNALTNIGQDEKFTKKNGQEFFVNFVATPIINKDIVEKVIIVFSDVSENRANREKVLEYFAQLGIFFRTNMSIEENIEKISMYLADDNFDKNSLNNVKEKISKIEDVFKIINKNEWVQLYSNIWKNNKNLEQRKDGSFIDPK